MIERAKRFGHLEWLWVAYIAFCALIASTHEIVGGIGLGLIFEALLFPVGLLLGYWSFYSRLPDEFQVGILALVVVLNGGLWYGFLRLCFRRKRRVSVEAASCGGEGPPGSIRAKRRFGILEWLWVAHTALWLVTGFLFIVTQDVDWEIAVTGLALPLCLPLSGSLGYQGLDEWLRAPLFAVVLFLNGGLWYGLLRLGLRREQAVLPTTPDGRPWRAIVNFHRRWMAGQPGDDPILAHLLLIPAILWMVLGIHHWSAFLFSMGAAVYCMMVVAVVVAESRRAAAPRAPSPATGPFARMDRAGWLRGQRTALRIALGLLIGVLLAGAYIAWIAP